MEATWNFPTARVQGRAETLELPAIGSQNVRLTLWEKGLAFVDRPLNSEVREHLSDWYLQLNPNGVFRR
jgi:glutathione S-transferase